MRPVRINIENVLKNVRFDQLKADEKLLLSKSGLPGAADLFNEDDPARAAEATREFVYTFLTASPPPPKAPEGSKD
jgi:hypothetical protein